MSSAPQATPTPTTVTPAMGGAAEDSDTDFQSAYSASPRESYGEFDQAQSTMDQDGAISLLSTDHHNDFGAHQVSQPVTVTHERKTSSESSTATTVSPSSPTQPVYPLPGQL